MDALENCPNCGKPLADKALQGLCPDCLIKAGWPTASEHSAADVRHSAAPSLEEMAGLFPHLEMLELIGIGGMGAVFKARQPKLDRLVAVKSLSLGEDADPGFAERFTREAQALARLNHRNILAVHDFGQVEGYHYFIMEHVDGLNLREVQQAGTMSPQEALRIIPQICEALQYAHDQGVVHRDIKPENILLDKQGCIKIADFGLAKILGTERSSFALTEPHHIMGTPHYMAPEQVEHPQAVDHRADIYSLGVVFYEMLTGELPLGKFAPPSRKVQVDVRLDEVVLKALEKEPQQRYQQVDQVKTDIETIVHRTYSRRRKFSYGLVLRQVFRRIKCLGLHLVCSLQAHTRKLGVALIMLLICGLIALLAQGHLKHKEKMRGKQRLAVDHAFRYGIYDHLKKYRLYAANTLVSLSENFQQAAVRLEYVSYTGESELDVNDTDLFCRYLGSGQWRLHFSEQIPVPDLIVDASGPMKSGPLPMPPAPLPTAFDQIGLPYPCIKVTRGWDGTECLFPDPWAAMKAWRQTPEYQAWRKTKNVTSFTYCNTAGYLFGIHVSAWLASGSELMDRIEIRRPGRSLMAVAYPSHGNQHNYTIYVYDDRGRQHIAKLEAKHGEREDKGKPYVTKVVWGDRGKISRETRMIGQGLGFQQTTTFPGAEGGLYWQVNRFGVAFMEAIARPRIHGGGIKRWLNALEDAPFPEASTGTVTIDGALCFGPTHEVTLTSSLELQDCFLKPATGQVLSASDELMDSLRTRGRLGKFPVLDTWEWTEQQEVDLMMWRGDLILIDSCGERLSLSLDDPFSSLSPQYVNFIAQPFLEKRADSDRGGFTHPNGLWVFVTRQGRTALLEVIEHHKPSGKARLRFKLIEQVGNATPGQTLASSMSSTADVDYLPAPSGKK